MEARLVDKAEEFVKNELFKNSRILLKTSQIRKFLSALNFLKNKVLLEEEDLKPELNQQIQMLRARLAYQAGKKPEVKPLYTHLEPKIKEIKKKAIYGFCFICRSNSCLS